MATVTLPTRLRQVMRAMSWSQADLATAAGASRQTASRWMNNGKRGMRAEHGYAIADRTGFSARWILTGAEAPQPGFPLLVGEQLRHAKAVEAIVRQYQRSGK